jgi:hypothetical protein
MYSMANAASAQGLEVGKERLRQFLESSDTGRQAMAMSGGALNDNRRDESVRMDRLGADGKKDSKSADAEDLDDI